MTKSARFAPRAAAELRAEREWLRTRNPAAAAKFQRAVFAAARLLGEQPRIAPHRPELAQPPFRFIVVRGFPYLLAYRVREDGRPRILRVLHTSRDIPRVLADEQP